MDIGDRFRILIRHLNLNVNSFSREIGVAHTTLRNILAKTCNPGYTVLNKTVSTFPEISAEWLLTGKGNMIKEDTGNLFNEPIAPYGKSILEILKEKDERIEELKEIISLKSKALK